MRRWWALAAAAMVLVLAGCDAPTRPEYRERVSRIDLTIRLVDDGTFTMQAAVEYPSSDGGPFVVAPAPLGDVTAITLDGKPRNDGDLTLTQANATIGWTLDGSVERYADGAIVTLPIWTAPSDGVSNHDLRVPLHATIVLPTSPVGDVHWHGASPRDVNERQLGSIMLDGEIGTEHDSAVTFLLPSDAVPNARLLPGTNRVAAFADRQRGPDDDDAALTKSISDKATRDDLIADGYWVLVGLEIAIPFLVSAFWLLRAGAVRHRAERGVASESTNPPDELMPAVVALLHADGQDIGAEAVAATILDLVLRKAITIEGITSERYTLQVAGGGSTPGEDALLAALRASASADGKVVGPPLPISQHGAWWASLRADVVATARGAGLLRRRYPSGLFITCLVALAITTVPLYARTPEAVVFGIVAALVLGSIPYLGGFVPTEKGHHVRAQWNAYRRHLAGGALDDVGAPGIIVRGPELVAAAALRVATTAIHDLAPSDAKITEEVSA